MVKEGPLPRFPGDDHQPAWKILHAAHPEQGNSPLNMMRNLLISLPSLPNLKDTYRTFAWSPSSTPAWVKGPSAPNRRSRCQATLRSYFDLDMDRLSFMAENL